MSFERKEQPLPDWKDKPVSRRGFLGFAAGGAGAIVAGLIATPLIGSFISPLLKKKQSSTDWVDLGKIEKFKVGEPQLVQWTTAKLDGWVMDSAPRGAWVVRQSDQEFKVFNWRCTHLACIPTWKKKGDTHSTAYGTPMPNKDHFFCVCHDGVFDADGNVVAGPPPRPLDTLPVKVENGNVFTIYKDFRVGIPDKIEL